MAGNLSTTERRGRFMSRIRSRDTRPELALRKALWSAGLRGHRKNFRGLPGTPDVVFTKYGLAVFVDGDFWYGRDFAERRDGILAGNNGEFWVAKIERNMARDMEVYATLCFMGWRVLCFWGSNIMRDADGAVDEVCAVLSGSGSM